MAKGKKLSIYTAALIITIIGAGATLIIVDTAYSTAAAMEMAATDPANFHIDFKY